MNLSENLFNNRANYNYHKTMNFYQYKNKLHKLFKCLKLHIIVYKKI